MIKLITLFLCFFIQYSVGLADISSSQKGDNQILIHAAPTGQSGHSFCGSEASPCSLPVALHRAPPGSTILLEGGVYYGSYHITKTLAISSRSREMPAIMDGQRRNRIFWFDNVAANIEGIVFRNGHGDGAGCVLITRVGGQVDEATSVQKCSFLNCTTASGLGAESAASSRSMAAGALAILYERPPSYPIMEISRCNFNNNLARGHGKASGSVMVHYDNAQAQNVFACTNLILSQLGERSDVNQNLAAQGLGLESGTVFGRLRTYIYNGKPVYKTLDKANAVRRAKVPSMYLVYCSDQNYWALSIAVDGQKASQTLHIQAGGCIEPILTFRCSFGNVDCDSPTIAYRVYKGDQELISTPVYFACQDIGNECPSVIVDGAPPLQAHRNGLYVMAKTTFAGRPVFKQSPVDGELRAQWIRYCIPLNEWIIGDDDPSTVSESEQDCLRGIASGETAEMHPATVFGWRFWDSDSWRQSTFPGGITVTCAASVEARDYCPLISAVNFPTSVIGIQPTLRLNGTAFDRPNYVDAAHNINLWYCPRFKEWAMSTLPAPPNAADECIRSLSSPETIADDPRMSDKHWEMFLPSGDWVMLQSTMSLRCSSDCPRVYVEVEGSVSDSGVYESVASNKYTRHRLYRQNSLPFNLMYFSTESIRWILSSDSGEALYSSPPGDINELSPLAATNWTTASSEVVSLHTACDTHPSCSVLTVNTTEPSSPYKVQGNYVLQRYLIADRVVYASDQFVVINSTTHAQAFIFYCSRNRRWMLGPKPAMGQCDHWMSASPSGSYYPHLWTTWREERKGLALSCGKEGSGQLAVPATATFVPLNAPKGRREGTVSVYVSDIIADCNFTGNAATMYNEVSAAGALAVLFSKVRVGTGPTLLLRRTNIRANEGITTRHLSRPTRAHSAGGIIVSNSAPYVMPQLLLQDTTLMDNRGQVGGLYIDTIRAHSSKVVIARNVATHAGGGFAANFGNLTFISSSCKHNTGAVSGGCAWVDPVSIISMSRSEIINNSAKGSQGTSISGGTIHIVDCKVGELHHQSISPRALLLSSSELSCAKNMIPAALSSGFGCIPEVAGDAIVAQEAVALDTVASMNASQEGGITWWAYIVHYATIWSFPVTVYFALPHVWDLAAKYLPARAPHGRHTVKRRQ